MEAVLLYNQTEIEQHKKEVDLIMANLMMCKSVCFAGLLADLLYVDIQFPAFPTKLKLTFVAEAMRQSNQPEERIQELLNIAQVIEMHGKTKGKPPKMIIALEKCKRAIQAFYDTFLMENKGTMEDLHLLGLLPLANNDIPNHSKPIGLMVWDTIDEDAQKSIRIDLMKELMLTESAVPVFHSIAMLGEKPSEINSVDNNPDEVFYLEDFLYNIPLPYKLNSLQWITLREQMGNNSWTLMDELGKLKKQFSPIAFVKQNYTQLSTLYTVAINQLKTKLQQTIATNNLLNELKQEQKNNEGISIYLGITSCNRLFEIFERTGINSETISLYAKEELSTKTNLNNTTLFLFSK